MAHEVRACIDTKVVAHKDLEITVKSGGAKMGDTADQQGQHRMAAEGEFGEQEAPVLGQVCLID